MLNTICSQYMEEKRKETKQEKQELIKQIEESLQEAQAMQDQMQGQRQGQTSKVGQGPLQGASIDQAVLMKSLEDYKKQVQELSKKLHQSHMQVQSQQRDIEAYNQKIFALTAQLKGSASPPGQPALQAGDASKSAQGAPEQLGSESLVHQQSQFQKLMQMVEEVKKQYQEDLQKVSQEIQQKNKKSFESIVQQHDKQKSELMLQLNAAKEECSQLKQQNQLLQNQLNASTASWSAGHPTSATDNTHQAGGESYFPQHFLSQLDQSQGSETGALLRKIGQLQAQVAELRQHDQYTPDYWSEQVELLQCENLQLREELSEQRASFDRFHDGRQKKTLFQLKGLQQLSQQCQYLKQQIVQIKEQQLEEVQAIRKQYNQLVASGHPD